MYDGISIESDDQQTNERILTDPKFNFIMKVDQHGEVSYKKHVKYKGMYMEAFKRRGKMIITIRGNLMKYHTGKKNIRNFPLWEALEAITEFADEFHLDMSKVRVFYVEWGLNLKLPIGITPAQVIHNIVDVRGVLPVATVYPKNGGYMSEYNLNHYDVKIYNKSAQHPELPKNIIRYELRFLTTDILAKCGVLTMSDLFDNRVTNLLQEELLRLANDIVFYDCSMKREVLTKLDKRVLLMFLQYNNPQSWYFLKANPDRYCKKKKSFSNHVTQVSGIEWNKLFSDLIIQESEKLLFEAINKAQKKEVKQNTIAL